MQGLDRFLEAQEHSYEVALAEVKNGRKASHWMWYIFPQIEGLGFSYYAHYYAIRDLQEARDYLNHEILGKRLIEISKALLGLDSNDPVQIFGHTDSLKLRSSMTLFSLVSGDDTTFNDVLDKFFKGIKDGKTLKILNII